MMKRMLALLLAAMLLLGAWALSAAAEDGQRVTVLFTHDMHSHFEPVPAEDGGTHSGFARLKTLVDRERAKGDVLLLDGGDFSMGTLYQAVYATDAAELTMMAELSYDATTIGNHEFDYRGVGMANMLNTAVENAEREGLTLPALLNANIDWSTVKDEGGEALRAAMENYGAKPAVMLECSGVKVGVFGVMGVDSQDCAPLAPVDFIDVTECAKQQVAQLQAEGAELIVCLSHSGVWDEAERSEDELLAQAVPEIDLIISGHTHTRLDAPIVHGTTYIASCGDYIQNLGRIVLERDGDHWRAAEYALIPTDDSVPEDAAIAEKVLEYRDRVSENYLAQFGYTYEQVLCQNPGNLVSEREMLADAMVSAVKAAEGDDYVPVSLAVVPAGIIRAELPEGDVRTSDAYNVLSLGIGADGVPGYPLVSVYLTGRELQDVAEVDVSVSKIMTGTNLYPSGAGWEYMPNRLILSRVTDVWLYDENGEKVEPEAEKLYRVVADLYSAQLLGTVKSKSFGLLSLEPKDASGALIADFEQHIIHKQDGSEVKSWAALADYLYAMGGGDGTGSIDAMYQQPVGRIVVSEAKGIGDHLKNPGRIWYVIAGAVAALAVIIVVIVLAVRAVVRVCRRRKAKK